MHNCVTERRSHFMLAHHIQNKTQRKTDRLGLPGKFRHHFGKIKRSKMSGKYKHVSHLEVLIKVYLKFFYYISYEAAKLHEITQITVRVVTK